MDGAADIQVFGQLGIETWDSNIDRNNGTNQMTTEIAVVSVVPQDTVKKEYPKTGETNQSIYFSFLGISLLFLLLLLLKKNKHRRNRWPKIYKVK
ncbi:LPXTG cell wall anchor domain-containing protein [Enterococcus casseliflavus]|nr:LPXTG cell wall anchor domain-containing protein [Enterococcus casseliflavus]